MFVGDYYHKRLLIEDEFESLISNNNQSNTTQISSHPAVKTRHLLHDTDTVHDDLMRSIPRHTIFQLLSLRKVPYDVSLNFILTESYK